jgi:ATP-dependent DNA helicase RecQ
VERYQIQKTQVDSIIDYAVNNVCRSQQLLRYFNEANAPICGVCDVCLEAKKSAKNTNTAKVISKLILDIMIDKSLTLNELVNLVSTGSESEKLNVIRMLLDAGTIKVNGEYYHL